MAAKFKLIIILIALGVFAGACVHKPSRTIACLSEEESDKGTLLLKSIDLSEDNKWMQGECKIFDDKIKITKLGPFDNVTERFKIIDFEEKPFSLKDHPELLETIKRLASSQGSSRHLESLPGPEKSYIAVYRVDGVFQKNVLFYTLFRSFTFEPYPYGKQVSLPGADEYTYHAPGVKELIHLLNESCKGRIMQ